MGAEFGDLAVVEHRDPVRVAGGVQAVRDGDDRPAASTAANDRPSAGPPPGEQGGGLVQDEGVRVGQDEAGQCQLLDLCRVERLAAGPGRSCRGRFFRPAPGVDGVRAADLVVCGVRAAMARLSRSVPRKT